jgi:hypothetical protein
MEACQQVKRSLDCEARLMERLPTSIDCKSLTTKFGRICSQADIDYALAALRSDADRLCALKAKSEIALYKPDFDNNKVSLVCYQAAQPCGSECMQIEVNEIP